MTQVREDNFGKLDLMRKLEAKDVVFQVAGEERTTQSAYGSWVRACEKAEQLNRTEPVHVSVYQLLPNEDVEPLDVFFFAG